MIDRYDNYFIAEGDPSKSKDLEKIKNIYYDLINKIITKSTNNYEEFPIRNKKNQITFSKTSLNIADLKIIYDYLIKLKEIPVVNYKFTLQMEYNLSEQEAEKIIKLENVLITSISNLLNKYNNSKKILKNPNLLKTASKEMKNYIIPLKNNLKFYEVILKREKILGNISKEEYINTLGY